MPSKRFDTSKRFSRRQVFQSGAAAMLLPAAGSAAPAKTEPAGVYSRLGVTPFINMTATYTINGGAPMLAEVKQAMEDASQWAVNLDELMEKAGARVAELLGAESAIITCGCAAALVHATAASMTGGDPEKMKQLPETSGLRNEVLIAKQSRNDYDHAFRAPGAKLIEFDSKEEFYAALSQRTAMVAVLGTGEAKQNVRLEEIAEAAHKRGVPVVVDAAAELPIKPNPYLSRGADLVAYSGGKILRGPQSAGVLAGRKDLVAAAWWNSAPHHAFGRSMKVSKEEVVGMVTALEFFHGKRNLEAEYQTWRSWYQQIAAELAKIPGVTAKMNPPAGASPFPTMEVAWDPQRIRVTGAEVYEQLLHGEPRIMSHAGGESTSFLIRAVAMRPEHPAMVAKRLTEIFGASGHAAAKDQPAPAGSLAGTWDVELKFAAGHAKHTLVLEQTSPGRIQGLHLGLHAKAKLKGKAEGRNVEFTSVLAVEGMHIPYRFRGSLEGDGMAGEVELGEFGRAKWSARRVG
ncbi:MAG: aminotransferase class V-fold PLP-dependent enzyme [Bryobacterales bacterium]|nr:aminotransferase class V-fold PLP-dependent enzyme [Bryobacterales bacterium]